MAEECISRPIPKGFFFTLQSSKLTTTDVEGLRVADISILPQQVAGNTAAQAMAIGWLAADVIRSTS